MKENIQKLINALMKADDIYNQIPFSNDVDSMSLKAKIASAVMLARKLDSDPQTGTSLEEFIQSEATRDII